MEKLVNASDFSYTNLSIDKLYDSFPRNGDRTAVSAHLDEIIKRVTDPMKPSQYSPDIYSADVSKIGDLRWIIELDMKRSKVLKRQIHYWPSSIHMIIQRQDDKYCVESFTIRLPVEFGMDYDLR